MDKLLIIDGSSLLNSQYFGNIPNSLKDAKDLRKKAKSNEEVEFANKKILEAYKDILQTKDGVYTNAVYGFMKYLVSAIKVLNPKYLAITWDVTRNTFRRELMPEYKGNRGAVDDPLKAQFKTCQELLRKIGIAQYFSEEYESDDFCGSLVKKFEGLVDINILTKDHDFFQLVSDHTNVLLLCQTAKIAKELNDKHSIDAKTIPQKTFVVNNDTLLAEYELSADKVALVKGLAGDSSDNIPGIPNIGEGSAKILSKIYSSVEEIYDVIDGKNEEELKKIAADWKAQGLKRNPMKYLLAEHVFENGEESLSAKEIGILSQKLATIKTDIDLDVSIDDLALNYDKEVIGNALKEYEIVSISL